LVNSQEMPGADKRCRRFAGWAAAIAGWAAATAMAASADPILDWNATIRQVIQANSTNADPGWSTRSMAMANGAMYDVTMAFTPTHRQYQFAGSAPAGASQDAAVAQAAYETMLDCYPDQQTILDATLATKLNAISDGPEKSAGVAFGSLVAQTYGNWRSNDGSSGVVLYTPQPAGTIGHWQPDPTRPAPQQAWGPAWGDVTPFAMTSSAQFTPPGPPSVTSREYTEAFNEVKSLGALNSATRTADQTDVGIFWGYDRQGMGPPPVLYSRNLSDVAEQQGNSQTENARLFAMASVAMADASIAAWEAKFAHDFWRPVTAIRAAESDGNPDTAGDADWIPLGAPGSAPNLSTDDFTPPFPAYTSGHATFGGTVYEVLRQFYGSDTLSFRLHSAEAIPSGIGFRDFTSFSQAETENALSRIYLGIHWSFDAMDGIALGNQIGEYVFANHFQPVPEPSSLIGVCLGACALAAWSRRSAR
jgi:hypothetical protein